MRDDPADVDTYEVLSWEPRGPVDRLAVVIYRTFVRHWTWHVGAMAVLLLLGQFAVVSMVVFSSPGVTAFTLLSVVPALLLAGWVYRLSDVHQPIGTLAITFVLGGLFSNFASLIDSTAGSVIQGIPIVGLTLFYFLIVGPVEEVTKWLAVRLWAFRRPTFTHVVDGAVYGAAAGLGFASMENVIYVGGHVLNSAGPNVSFFHSTITIAGTRALAGPGHVIYSTIAGYYLGLSKFAPDRKGPIVVKGLLLAAVIHGLYDVLVSFPIFVQPLPFFAFILVFDGLFGLVIYRKLVHYRRTERRLEGIGDADSSVEGAG